MATRGQMPRFYFNVLVGPHVILDIEGTDLSSLQEAQADALLDARSLMSAAILEGDDISGRSIEIRSETGDVLFILPFAAAVKRSS
jgi:hypothetical protein